MQLGEFLDIKNFHGCLLWLTIKLLVKHIHIHVPSVWGKTQLLYQRAGWHSMSRSSLRASLALGQCAYLPGLPNMLTNPLVKGMHVHHYLSYVTLTSPYKKKAQVWVRKRPGHQGKTTQGHCRFTWQFCRKLIVKGKWILIIISFVPLVPCYHPNSKQFKGVFH